MLPETTLEGLVEEGVVLVGATTENPFFTVNRALLSRSQVLAFEPLSSDALRQVVQRTIEDRERGLGELDVDTDEEAMEFLVRTSDGNARRALTALEIAVRSLPNAPRHQTANDRG